MKRFIDIGANLTDLMYQGIYNGTKKHEADLQNVLKRSWERGLHKIIITGGNLTESENAIDLAKQNDKLYATVGCHPTRCTEFEQNEEGPEDYLNKLEELINKHREKVVAIGECGLDYERLQFCSKDVQKKYFEYQLKLSEKLKLPLFLHCRNAAADLYEILTRFNGLKGVVHSFDGTIDEANKFIDLGYYIGLNGCSLKTQDNLETVKALPDNKILIETDCPWCEIRPTHAGFKFITDENKSLPSVKKEKWRADSMVKSRNEPINISQVLDVVSFVREQNPEDLSEKIYQNTMDLFFSTQ